MIFCSLLNYSLIFSFLSTKLGKCTPIVPCYSDLFHSEGSTLDQLVRVERTKWVERKGTRGIFLNPPWEGCLFSWGNFWCLCVCVCVCLSVFIFAALGITRPFMEGFGWNFQNICILVTSRDVFLGFSIS